MSIENEIEDLSPELFDISDIEWDVIRTKSLREIHLRAKSQSAFNLMKFYLALKAYIESIEREIGVFDEAPEIQ